MRTAIGLLLAACCACLAAVSGCKSKETEGASRSAPAPVASSDEARVLAVLPADHRQVTSAASPGGGADPTPADRPEFIFSERRGSVAYVAEERGTFRVVHDGRPGKPYPAVGRVVLSPDGRRCAYPAFAGGKWRMVVDGKEGAIFDAVEHPVFSQDGAHLAYQARTGDSWHLVIDGVVHGGSKTRYLTHEFGADSSRIVFVVDAGDGWGRLVVSDLGLERQTVVDPRVSSVLLSSERTRVAAVSASGGKRSVLSFGLDDPAGVKRGPSHDDVYGLALGADGLSLAYVAERSGDRFVVLDDREERLPPGEEMVGVPVVRSGKNGLGAIVISNESVLLRQFFAAAAKAAPYEEIDDLVYSRDGGSHAYAAASDGRAFVVVSGNEGPRFDRVVSPRFSPDGKYLVYRARKDGKRFVVVAGADGRTIRQHPAYEQVFPVHFTADGKAVAYGVKEGRQLAWKVEPL